MNKKVNSPKTSALSDALMELCDKLGLDAAIKTVEESHAELCEKAGRKVTLSSHELVHLKNGLVIDFKLKTASRDGESIFLSPSEWSILTSIVGMAGAPASKAYLAEELYAKLPQPRKSNVVDVYICKLREKIGGNAILTMRGLGYVMA